MKPAEETLKSMFLNMAQLAAEEYDWQTVYDEVDYRQLGFTFGFAFLILISAWILFEILAQTGPTRSLYRQRLFHSSCVKATIAGTDFRAAPPDVRSFYSVVFGAFGIPTDKLPGLMGPGAHLSYRLMQHCLYFGHISVIYALIVLIPVFLSQYYRHTDRRQEFLKMIGVNYVSPSNPSHMWMIVISAYLMTYYWMLVIYSEWQHVKKVRLAWEHDSRSLHFQSHYSLLVERDMERKPVKIKPYLAKLLQKGESEIPLLAPVYPATKLWALESRREWAASSLACIGGGGKTVEELDTAISQEKVCLRNRVRDNCEEVESSRVREARAHRKSTTRVDLNADIDEDLKPEVGGLSATTIKSTSTFLGVLSRVFITYRPTTYFVTLKSLTDRTVLSRMYDNEGASSFARLSQAPPVCDLIWDNVTVERKTIETRKYLVRILLFIFGVTYAIPIIQIQNLARDYNKKLLENVDRVDDPSFGSDQWNAEIIALYFPALLQILLSQLLPMVFLTITKRYERHKTVQEVTKFVMHRAFLFQLLTVYLFVFEEIWFDVTKVTGGFLVFFDSLIARLRRLGQAIPPVSLYFASTVILSLVTEVTVEVISPVLFMRSLYARYVRGNRNAWEDIGLIHFRYGSSMNNYLTLLNVMFTFGIIAPVVVFVCWIFWAVAYIWNTYAFIFLNNRRSEEATAFSATIYSGISTSLILSQFALFFLLWSLDSTTWNNNIQGEVYASAALIALIFLFKYVVMRDFEVRAGDAISLALASDIDLIHKSDDIVRRLDQKYYYQPEIQNGTPPPSQQSSQTPSETETKVFDLFDGDPRESETASLIEKDA